MPFETLAPILGYTLLGAIPLVAGWTYLVSLAHEHDLTLFGACRCFACLLAYKLDRHHGRHRLEDLYSRQRHIRADFHTLTPES
ncbi:hypothetical protein Afil01_61710 [Actinorhabdospora filicis]|uniref:Uncharacterized protein n=1 Tax=Actinorhabdospora filicis TaxID=1785913 RepID=A0A9W6WC75_9ACTN|nr:hypothetical protein [Actinorhabdospora filicis]GLZ81364.1 hypothetical protein Afil01_61710 [Actinorhabdospora filicis]